MSVKNEIEKGSLSLKIKMFVKFEKEKCPLILKQKNVH